MRQLYLAEKLALSAEVYVTGFDKNVYTPERAVLTDSLLSLAERADCLVLPLPVTSDNVMVSTPFYKQSLPLDNLLSAVKEGGLIFGGCISPDVAALFNKHNLETIDYLEREELSVMNAVPTAEGAVQIAMEELATTLYGRNILILGMGRIEKVLIKILTGFSCRITVAARKYSDLAWAEVYGCKGVHIRSIEPALEDAEVLFNTVPAMILTGERLMRLHKDCLLIDLASKPGGVDLRTAAGLGIKTVWALSLPGKLALVSAGEMIASAILNILTERGEWDG